MNQRRILIASNYDDARFTETFVNLPAMDMAKASGICLTLNTINPHGPDYYMVVELDYVPNSFEP